MKKLALLFVLVLTIPFFITGCTGESEEKYTSYTLFCEYDEANHTLEGKESVEIFNKYDQKDLVDKLAQNVQIMEYL